MITTGQDLFNTIVTGLANQGWQRSYDTRLHLCRYRGPDKMRCAVGMVIPDEAYEPAMEDLPLDRVLTSCGIHEDNLSLLMSCQGAHDAGTNPTTMKRLFQQVAHEYELEWPL